MLSKGVKHRRALNRKARIWRRGKGPNWRSQWWLEFGYPFDLRRGRVKLGITDSLVFSRGVDTFQYGLGVEAFVNELLHEQKIHGLGVSEAALKSDGFYTAEIMNREAVEMGIDSPPMRGPSPLDELVKVFEGSAKFKEDFLKILIQAGNPDMKNLQDNKLDFHVFGYLTDAGLSKLRMEIFSVWAAEHNTFTMKLTEEDLAKRDTPIIRTMPYGKLGEVFDAPLGIRTYDRWRFLINERPEDEITEYDLNA